MRNTRCSLKAKRPSNGGLSCLILGMAVLSSFAGDPLSLHPSNPHYFLFRGKPTILITSGEHYGAVLNLDFDYVPYLNELHSKGLNHTRTFSGTYREVPASFGITENTLAPKPNRYLAPWARSTTPGYFDGGNKFDLSRWDEAYFVRLKDFVAQAATRGIVVELNLFCPFYDEELWQANPLNSRNNINGVGKCSGNEVYTLKDSGVTRIQKAAARKIVEALRDSDNVYFEVCNEPWCGNVTLAWQQAIISTIVDAEAPLPARHLISLNTAKLKITETNPAVSIYNFHYAAPADVMALNYHLGKALGDNETGFRGKENFVYRTEAWDCVLAGGALFSSLDYSFTVRHPDGSFQDYRSPGGGNETLRTQLRILKEFIYDLDFVRMAPDDSLIKGGVPAGLVSARVLAEKGRAYAVYLRRRTDADKFSVRWTGSVISPKNEIRTFCVVSTQGVRLLWSSPTVKKEVVPASCLTSPDGSGRGLRGEYFEDRKLKNLILERNDAVIDFDWSKADPIAANHPVGPLQLKLDLPARRYRAVWMDPRTAQVISSGELHHAGGNATLTVPVFAEDVALKVLAQEGSPRP